MQALQPDAIVLDLQMHPVSPPAPGLDGLATIRMIKKDWPAIRIVVLTMFATDRTSALAAGADAFLLKGCPTSELLDAVMPDWTGRALAKSAPFPRQDTRRKGSWTKAFWTRPHGF